METNRHVLVFYTLLLKLKLVSRFTCDKIYGVEWRFIAHQRVLQPFTEELHSLSGKKYCLAKSVPWNQYFDWLIVFLPQNSQVKPDFL